MNKQKMYWQILHAAGKVVEKHVNKGEDVYDVRDVCKSEPTNNLMVREKETNIKLVFGIIMHSSSTQRNAMKYANVLNETHTKKFWKWNI